MGKVGEAQPDVNFQIIKAKVIDLRLTYIIHIQHPR
jgi:hypothetical protein